MQASDWSMAVFYKSRIPSWDAETQQPGQMAVPNGKNGEDFMDTASIKETGE